MNNRICFSKSTGTQDTKWSHFPLLSERKAAESTVTVEIGAGREREVRAE